MAQDNPIAHELSSVEETAPQGQVATLKSALELAKAKEVEFYRRPIQYAMHAVQLVNELLAEPDLSEESQIGYRLVQQRLLSAIRVMQLPEETFDDRTPVSPC